MKTASTHAASRPADVASTTPALSAAADLSRQQMVVANESASAMFRGFEAMRKIHEQAAHDATARHAAAAEKMRSPRQAAELLQIQSELIRRDVEGAMGYWQELAAAALEMQNEMMGCASHLVDSDTLLESAHALAFMRAPLR